MSLPLIKQGPNAGLPRLDEQARSSSFYEFWPVWVLYIPVVFYWIWLALRYRGFGLPLAANPNVFLAGMLGESKIDLLASAGAKAQAHILPFVAFVVEPEDPLNKVNARNAQVLLDQANLTYPLVAKPDEGCRGAGVQIVASALDLEVYLSAFPVGERLMLQRLSAYKAEAGVFYERMPNESQGKVVSITLKYRATVMGDGKRTVEELVEADGRACQLRALYRERLGDTWHSVPSLNEEIPLVFAGSHCRGAIFKDGCKHITQTLSDKIDTIMQDFPAFYYGRLDIKFDNLNDFIEGRDFDIIELNGASSEQTHIWDSQTPVLVVVKTLLQQYKTLFMIGADLRNKGVIVPSLFTLIKVWWRDMTSKTTYPNTH